MISWNFSTGLRPDVIQYTLEDLPWNQCSIPIFERMVIKTSLFSLISVQFTARKCLWCLVSLQRLKQECWRCGSSADKDTPEFQAGQRGCASAGYRRGPTSVSESLNILRLWQKHVVQTWRLSQPSGYDRPLTWEHAASNLGWMHFWVLCNIYSHTTSCQPFTEWMDLISIWKKN